MRLLDRYLLRELLTPFGYCLGGFLVFWISYDAFNQLTDFQERKLHPLDVVEYYMAAAPGFLVTVLPVALLLALLYTLTHLARHHELTAIRAAGVSLWRLDAPYLAVGVVASLGLFALNEFVAPRGDEWAEHILSRQVSRAGGAAAQSQFHGFVNARAHRLWHFDEYRARSSEIIVPTVSWTLPDGSWRQLRATHAIRTNGVWMFFDVKQFAQTGTDAPLLPSFQTNVLTMPEFDETPQDILDEMKFSGYQGFGSTRKADIPLLDLLRHLRRHPDLARPEHFWLFSRHPNPAFADGFRLFTKLHGRLAAPWTCLVVVLIAVPFGAVSGRRNLFVGVAGSIFICFTYFVLQQVGLAMGAGGFFPAWLAAWLPNLTFGAVGVALTMRVR